MTKLLLIASLLLGMWFWRSVLHRTPIEKRREFIWNSAIWGLLLISIGLVVTGKMHWIGAGLAALVPIVKWIIIWGLRALPLIRALGFNKQIPSQFRTNNLFVQVNFASHHMDGEVLTGNYQGKKLSELNLDQLKLLADNFKESDRESFILLQAYMLRTRRNSDFEESSYNAPRPNFRNLRKRRPWKYLDWIKMPQKMRC